MRRRPPDAGRDRHQRPLCQAFAVGHADWGAPGQGLAVIALYPSPQVLALQASLQAAISRPPSPAARPPAFVTDPGEDISQSTLDWVDGLSPLRSTPTGTPLTSPSASPPSTTLKTIETEPFDAFTVPPAGVAVYQLGSSGAARKFLRS